MPVITLCLFFRCTACAARSPKACVDDAGALCNTQNKASRRMRVCPEQRASSSNIDLECVAGLVGTALAQ